MCSRLLLYPHMREGTRRRAVQNPKRAGMQIQPLGLAGFQPGADYFQSNLDELKKAAQRAIDKISGKKNEKPSFTDDGQTKYVTIENLASYT